ncbi:glycosyltransferase [Methylobacterium sp. NEAU 140]|uniref:glycosyltransferase n=1 Tax=Methylobacterium sp. NEAU 140 TaxID=3064945 RepID=UPI002733A586|nr:glycosyltransferase [Methylobacterium sp. NEAU 140]MDP4021308.1 glycosyltransferase [Methylobacterium sp. NEAU 140]
MRVLIAVTHLLGAGHLTRAAALARAFAGAGHAVTLVSGGAPAPLVRLDGVRLVQLPPLRAAGFDFTRLVGPDGQSADADLLGRRRAVLLDALCEAAPDVVVTELFPFGRRALADEFLALVEAARTRRPRPLILASVRDVLVAPDRPEKVARAHALIADLYDAVLVHGDPALVPLDASWPLDPQTREKVHDTGYVDEDAAIAPGDRSGILVAAGSSAAGLSLLRAAAGAARRRPDLGWRILVGHGVPDPEMSEIAHGLPEGTVERARPDYRALLAASAVSVSQCGYNTAVDLLATGTPAVLVPFEAGRETEQRLRAERLAARGLAHVLPEAALCEDTLLATVAALTSTLREGGGGDPGGTGALDPAPSLPLPPSGRDMTFDLDAHPGPSGRIDLNGAARSVAIVEGLLALRRRRTAPEPFDLTRLRIALDHAAEEGRRVPVWWRDDDAVAATPALDRLLALAAAHAAPLLVAAIPARIEPSLSRRLADADGVSAAIHGLAHADHAPPGAKSAEFGPHRPLAALRADAAAGLRFARARLPADRLLPVFVPPWNRLARDLAAVLPSLGYRGLSTAGGPPVDGLVRADATFDPIDWRGTRSLRDPGALLDDLAIQIAGDAGSPIGLLTHHLAHDPAIWAFVEALLPVLLRHPAVTVCDPRDLFAPRVDAAAAPPSIPVPDRARAG